MPMLSDRHAVVGEIGPGHLRFAVADIDELVIDHYVNFKTSDFDSIEVALDAYFKSLPGQPGKISLAVAGDVSDNQARISHLPWTFSARELQNAFAVPSVRLMRDIDAVSSCVPTLPPHELVKLTSPSPQSGPKGVVLLDRDLEAAMVAPHQHGWTVLHGRVGEMSFGADSNEELLLVQAMRHGIGRIALKRVLTSTGLTALYDALRLRSGLDAPSWSAFDIARAALSAEPDPIAHDALRHFANWLARFAGDLAAAYGAEGGIYLSGSLAIELREILRSEAFVESFSAAGGPDGFTSNVPVYLVTATNLALRGAALAIS